MTIVGITGGIGSGKTTIAQCFKDWGIPVYNADDVARKLMHSSPIKEGILNLFGKEAYSNDQLNRALIREAIFKDDTLRIKVNNIVHPAVGEHFTDWVKRQNSAYILKEAAIIFEAGLTDQYDFIITVVAEETERIKRVLKRPGLNTNQVLEIISKQWRDDKKIKLSDYVITNNNLDLAKKQAYTIHLDILKRLGLD